MEVKPARPRNGPQVGILLQELIGRKQKGCKRWLGAIFNKIEMSTLKISLINCIGTPPNYPSKNMLSIADSGANIHLAKQSTTIIAPVIISDDTKSRLPYGRTIESS